MSEFEGKIGRTREESIPHWPARTTAPKGAPNIVIIYMDDMGWSDPGCYGSEINTPNLDSMARECIRFSQMYNMVRCCPTRALSCRAFRPRIHPVNVAGSCVDGEASVGEKAKLF